MVRYLIAYVATVIVMIAIDLLWLGVIAKPMYQQGIGHLMAAQPNIPAAILFYLIFPLGLMVFAVLPNAAPAAWSKALIYGALFGFFAYATYDLTNLATLKQWPVALSVIDIAWGSLVSSVASVSGKLVLDRL